MPVRDHVESSLVDDYLVWSLVVDAPMFRGTRDQVSVFCFLLWEEMQTAGDRLFESADATGSSASLSGKWGEHILCGEAMGISGLLPRHRIRAFADLMFPGYPGCDFVDEEAVTANAEKISALIQPFGDDE